MRRIIREKRNSKFNFEKLDVSKAEVLDTMLLRTLNNAVTKEYPGHIVDMCPNKDTSILFKTKSSRGLKRELKKLCRLVGWNGPIEVHYI